VAKETSVSNPHEKEDPIRAARESVEGAGVVPARTGLPGECPGDVIDRFELLQVLGEGGMGTVWVAQQNEPVRRKVALKVIKLGMDTREVVARFEAERQALALMDHPQIAKVLDGGATRFGRPYFVMELVYGDPMTDYCDRVGLPLRKRLELFIQVCEAIQHAHQKGIIHRDIKPSNVLVVEQDGVPSSRVIDFGIAKATNAELTQRTIFTQQAQIVGTPEYMAPEQAEFSRLDIDTRADVYSLGVLLYELLTGTKPLDIGSALQSGYTEVLRTIREVNPARPSTRISGLGDEALQIAERRGDDVESLHRRLRGELDWIVMKALEKDRSRRYESASAFGSDLERFLRREAVLAAPPSAIYLLRKFVSRHRGAVVAGVTTVLLLVAAIVGTSMGLLRAREEARRAEYEAGRAREVQHFLEQMLASLDPEVTQGRDTTVLRGILAEAETRLQNNQLSDELIEAELSVVIGKTYYALGDYSESHQFLQSAREIQDRQLDEGHPDRLEALAQLARLLHAQGEYDESLKFAQEVLALRRQVHGDQHVQTLESINHLGDLFLELADYPRAEELYREALESRRIVLGEEHTQTLQSLSDLGDLHYMLNQHEQAEPLYRKALEIRRKTLGGQHPDTLRSMSDMGQLLAEDGKPAEAMIFCRQAFDGRQQVLGEEHPLTLWSMADVGHLHAILGNQEQAIDLLRESYEGRCLALGLLHLDTLDVLEELTAELIESGELTAAKRYARDLVAARHKVSVDSEALRVAEQLLDEALEGGAE
jgi:serine/threonine protein kinase